MADTIVLESSAAPVSIAFDDSDFNLRDNPQQVANRIASIAGHLVDALAQIYNPAALAVVLDAAAESANATARNAAPTPDALRTLAGIMREQRALRTAPCGGHVN